MYWVAGSQPRCRRGQPQRLVRHAPLAQRVAPAGRRQRRAAVAGRLAGTVFGSDRTGADDSCSCAQRPGVAEKYSTFAAE